MKFLREFYRVMRSVLFTAIIMAVTLYVLFYLALSLPFVQNYICGIAEREVSKFLKTDVKIGSLEISPFSRIILNDVEIPTPEGEKCIKAGKIAAGISLSDLLRDRKIIITFAEILDLNASVSQPAKAAPLNIQFIIEAFKPKDPSKPPTLFDLKIRNVVIRRLSGTFDREWIPRSGKRNKIDLNHLSLSNVALDLTLPRISNNEYRIDLRRLSLEEKSGFKLTKLALKALLSEKELSINDLEIELPGTFIHPSDLSVHYSSMKDMGEAILNGRHRLRLSNNKITLSDFSCFLPALDNFSEPLFLSLDVAGSKREIDIKELYINTANNRLSLNLKGSLGLRQKKGLMPEISVSRLRLNVTSSEMSKLISHLSPLDENTNRRLMALGEINMDGTGSFLNHKAIFKGQISTGLGSLQIDADSQFASSGIAALNGKIHTSGIDLAKILPESGLGRLIFDIDTKLRFTGNIPDGLARAEIGLIEYKGHTLNDIFLDVTKNSDNIKGELSVNDAAASLRAEADVILNNGLKKVQGTFNIDHFYPSQIGLMPNSSFNAFSGNLTADLDFYNKWDFIGSLTGNEINIRHKDGRTLTLHELSLSSMQDPENGFRDMKLDCDYLSSELYGHFHPEKLPGIFRYMLSKALPSFIPPPSQIPQFNEEDLRLFLTLHEDNTLIDFFNLPVRMLTNVGVRMNLNGAAGKAGLDVEIPYLQQGKNKLIRDTALRLSLDDNEESAVLEFGTTLPGKKSDVSILLESTAIADKVTTDISWEFQSAKAYNGHISLESLLKKNPANHHIDVETRVMPGSFQVNDSLWTVAPASIKYYDKLLEVDNLRVSHGNQYIDINGKASSLPSDTLTVSLSDMDLDYVFETLNINYVTFGGTATGKVRACAAFSSLPKAFTDGLTVKNLSYNGARLGNALLSSRWNHLQKRVDIRADINTGNRKPTIVDGGIWVTRDSLSFDLDANKVNIKFLQPFMQAFSSDVSGEASGKAKLYGTFSDIDLTGKLFADTIKLKLDYTNTYYSGSDSVFLYPGHIEIPDFRLYDQFGNSAIFSGWLKHRYFHDPAFEFKLKDAHNLLCYNTDARFNPDWYGTIYGNGSATITGDPGMVNILVDMSTAAGSDFTFVINEKEAADDYRFLSFTDKRKEARLRALPDTTPEFIRLFNRRIEQMQGPGAGFSLDLRASITPETQINLIMDPTAGDRIRAHGEGAIQIAYSSDKDEMTMYGKYVVAEGMYNFTLQDLILKDFIIRPGSSVTFNGDPLQAVLDITAAYRVNTNLADLDPSFASDRDLNRTNVPVEALLLVRGDLDSPDIQFDIDLPTVNSDVERKVRSIISTDDLMSRQVIYLLALNRFYSPEFMNSTSNGGGEIASVASSTLSSQISNIIGALSDKWTIAPSFRTDKGDFSDMEVDVTIASRFFNNRLLVNGNLGYRDRTTSNTTFVGDFDIEYLLNRSGNLRLKAYNHFNDQNYYLKSALTTQGVGLVLRRDFDDPLSWFKRLRKKFSKKKQEK